ncbi:SDR family NAD(P)-dependent oxidoreductase [Streptomyces daliensis]
MTAPGRGGPRIAPHAPTGRTAVIDCRTGERTSYGQLAEAVDGFANALVRRGLRPGETVALVLDNSAVFAAAYHGTLRAGGTVQPLDPLAPPAMWAQAMDAAQARWLVAPSAVRQRLNRLAPPRSARRTVLVDADGDGDGDGGPGQGPIGWSRLIAEEHQSVTLPDATPDTVALLASSSGTGGRTKQVAVTRRNLAVNLEQIHSRHHLSDTDVVMAVTPWRHIYGMQMAMNHTLHAGGTLVVCGPPFRFEEFLQAAEEHRASLAYLVPDIIGRLASEPAVDQHDLSALRAVFSGGAPLPPSVARECARRLDVPVLQGYGMTEAGCTHLTGDGTHAPPGSVGRPLPDTETRIAEPDTGRAQLVGTEGELWVRGPQISSGCLEGTSGTVASLTTDGWLRTGDLARVDADGNCTITGRRKELIKYKGHQVAPADLEAVLLTHPAVADAAVVGVPDPARGELPKAYVVLHRDIPLNDLVDYTSARVPPHMRVRLIEQAQALPRNAAGKLLRRDLAPAREPAATAEPSGPSGPVQPSEELPVRPLDGRTVLITGAGRGLGRFLADAFADAGARLVLTGRDPGTLAEAEAALEARGTPVLTVPADLTDPAAMPKAVECAKDTFGTLDILVNNAGVPGPHGPLWEVDPEEWQHTMDVNVVGTARACGAALPTLATGRGGRVINIASEAGRHRWPHASAYSVSKAAVIKLTENLAAELRPHGIPVFSFDPGLLDLGLIRDHLDHHPTGDPWTDRIGEWILTQRDEGRFTPPEHAAHALLRLADGDADHLSGHYITPDTELSPAGQQQAGTGTDQQHPTERTPR